MNHLELAALVVYVGFPFVLLPIELAILLDRVRAKPGQPRPRTISMLARDYAPRMTSVVFFYSAMPVHWFVPLGWASPAGTIAFWCLQAALLALNVAWWRRTAIQRRWWPPWLRWATWPPLYVAVGVLAAAFLFPQDGPLPWSP